MNVSTELICYVLIIRSDAKNSIAPTNSPGRGFATRSSSLSEANSFPSKSSGTRRLPFLSLETVQYLRALVLFCIQISLSYLVIPFFAKTLPGITRTERRNLLHKNDFVHWKRLMGESLSGSRSLVHCPKSFVSSKGIYRAGESLDFSAICGHKKHNNIYRMMH